MGLNVPTTAVVELPQVRSNAAIRQYRAVGTAGIAYA
jgi:hypothetical protein